MKRWKTDEIVKLLSDPNWVIEVQGPGGDGDSDNLVLEAKGGTARLFICGFDYNHGWIQNSSDCDIHLVAVSDGMDSRGGLNTTCRKTGAMYVEVRGRLEEAGFNTVPCLKDYF